ncbi:MAG: TonB-dependent receptor [Paludibacteraceae bacterium]|nr:TonB-dependent receptor [Paludibacteraceae bacterium]
MKPFFILPLLCLCAAISAQQPTRSDFPSTSDSVVRHVRLSDMIVTGVTGETDMRSASMPVNLIQSQDLRSLSSSNVIDAISRLPGVSQLTTGPGISKPVIRGLGYNRVVVIADGVRQEGQQWGDEHGVEVPDDAVSSVEVIKGPASLIYGSDAMAGVVIIHPYLAPAEGSVNASATTEYQTNNGLFRYALSAAGNHSGFVWNARYNDKRAHAYKNRYDGYVPGSQFAERSGHLMLGLNKRWGHSRLSWTAYHLTPSIIEGERDSVSGRLLSSNDNVKSYSKSLPFQQVKHYKLVWDNALRLSSGQLKAIFGYQQNRRQEFEESADDYALYLKLHTFTYDVRFLSRRFSGWKFATGVSGMCQWSVNGGDEYVIPDFRLQDVGIYTTAVKTLGFRWTLNGGLRYDWRHFRSDALEEDGDLRFSNLSRGFNALSGSLGAVYSITDDLHLRFNLARGFRAPGINELAANGVHEGSQRYEIGDARLSPEHSLQFDLSADYTSRFVSVRLSSFANRIDNFIFLRRSPDVFDPAYHTYVYDQGDARLLGFEVGFDLMPIRTLTFSNDFSFVDARQLNQPDSTRYLPFTPAPCWTASLRYDVLSRPRFCFERLSLTAAMDCFMRQSHVFTADGTETVTPSYALLSLSMRADLRIARRKVAELYVTADNIFDRAVQNHLSRLKYADFNPVTGRQGVFDMGRNFTFKLIVPVEF